MSVYDKLRFYFLFLCVFCPSVSAYLLPLSDTVISLCHAEFLEMEKHCIDVLLKKYHEVDMLAWV